MSIYLIIGGKGWIGGKIARALLAQGRRVRCLDRSGSGLADLAALGCEVVSGDIGDGASLVRATEDISAVYVAVHTMSRQAKRSSSQSFMTFEVAGALNILAACEARAVQRLIYLTSIGTSPDASSEWLRERAAIEKLLIESTVAATIIRPGMVVGAGGRGFETLVGQARNRLAIALDLDHQRMRTIAIDDLIQYLLDALDDPRTFDRAFDVGNDDVLTSREMIDIAAELVGNRRPFKIALPRSLLGHAAPFIDRLSGGPKGAFRGMLDSLNANASGDPTPIRALMPRELLGYPQAVKRAWRLDQDRNAAKRFVSIRSHTITQG